METSLKMRISKEDAEKINSEVDLCAYVAKKLRHKFFNKIKEYH